MKLIRSYCEAKLTQNSQLFHLAKPNSAKNTLHWIQMAIIRNSKGGKILFSWWKGHRIEESDEDRSYEHGPEVPSEEFTLLQRRVDRMEFRSEASCPRSTWFSSNWKQWKGKSQTSRNNWKATWQHHRGNPIFGVSRCTRFLAAPLIDKYYLCQI